MKKRREYTAPLTELVFLDLNDAVTEGTIINGSQSAEQFDSDADAKRFNDDFFSSDPWGDINDEAESSSNDDNLWSWK